jgi:hypothetical protein
MLSAPEKATGSNSYSDTPPDLLGSDHSMTAASDSPGLVSHRFQPLQPGEHESILNTPFPLNDTLLAIFRDHMADQFPFVIIPKSVTAATLMEKKPFLSMVIVMVAFKKDEEVQLATAKNIVDYLCQYMIVGGEKSLDLLQGLIIFVAWFADSPFDIERMRISC